MTHKTHRPFVVMKARTPLKNTIHEMAAEGLRLAVYDPAVSLIQPGLRPHANLTGLIALGAGYSPKMPKDRIPNTLTEALGVHPDHIKVPIPGELELFMPLSWALNHLNGDPIADTLRWLRMDVTPLVTPYSARLKTLSVEAIPNANQRFRVRVQIEGVPDAETTAWFLAHLESRHVQAVIRHAETLNDGTHFFTYDIPPHPQPFTELNALRYAVSRDDDMCYDLTYEFADILGVKHSRIVDAPHSNEQRHTRLVNLFLDSLMTLGSAQPNPHVIARFALAMHLLQKRVPSMAEIADDIHRRVQEQLDKMASTYRLAHTPELQAARQIASSFTHILNNDLPVVLPPPGQDDRLRRETLRRCAGLFAVPRNPRPPTSFHVVIMEVQTDHEGYVCKVHRLLPNKGLSQQPVLIEHAETAKLAYAIVRLLVAHYQWVVWQDRSAFLDLNNVPDPNFAPAYEEQKRYRRLKHLVEYGVLPDPPPPSYDDE